MRSCSPCSSRVSSSATRRSGLRPQRRMAHCAASSSSAIAPSQVHRLRRYTASCSRYGVRSSATVKVKGKLPPGVAQLTPKLSTKKPPPRVDLLEALRARGQRCAVRCIDRQRRARAPDDVAGAVGDDRVQPGAGLIQPRLRGPVGQSQLALRIHLGGGHEQIDLREQALLAGAACAVAEGALQRQRGEHQEHRQHQRGAQRHSCVQRSHRRPQATDTAEPVLDLNQETQGCQREPQHMHQHTKTARERAAGVLLRRSTGGPLGCRIA